MRYPNQLPELLRQYLAKNRELLPVTELEVLQKVISMIEAGPPSNNSVVRERLAWLLQFVELLKALQWLRDLL